MDDMIKINLNILKIKTKFIKYILNDKFNI